MATDPGSLVYGGREGSGAATIYRPRLNPHIGAMLQERAAKQKALVDQQKFDITHQEKRQKQVMDDISSNLGKPGTFQQEDSVAEIERFKSEGINYANENPYANPGEIYSKFSSNREALNRNIAKRNEVQADIEDNMKVTNSDDLKDGDWINAYQSKLISDKNKDGSYVNRNINDIDRDRLKNVTTHPRSFNASKGIVDLATDIKAQVLSAADGEIKAGEYGLEYDTVSKKYRFKVDKTGKIADDVVKYVLENNSQIGDRIRWDIAKEKVAGNKPDKYLTIDEIDQIDKQFEAIQYRNDPSIVLQERERVRETLNQLQQTESRHDLNFRKYADGEGNGDSDLNPVNVRLERIGQIRDVFNAGINPSKPGLDAIAGLANGKLGTYQIMKAEPVLYNKENGAEISPEQYKKDVERVFKDKPEMRDKVLKSAPNSFDQGGGEGKPGSKSTLKVTVRTSTAEGEPLTQNIFIDLTKPESIEVLNGIIETIPGSEAISNEDLYIEQKKKKKGVKSSGVFTTGKTDEPESQTKKAPVTWEN